LIFFREKPFLWDLRGFHPEIMVKNFGVQDLQLVDRIFWQVSGLTAYSFHKRNPSVNIQVIDEHRINNAAA